MLNVNVDDTIENNFVNNMWKRKYILYWY